MPFTKGHKLSKGRKTGSRNKSTLIREAKEVIAKEGLLDELNGRLDDDKQRSSISIESLVQFAGKVMPKVHNISADYNFNLVSHVIRPALDIDAVDAEAITEHNDTKTVSLSPASDNQPSAKKWEPIEKKEK
jgi:hypothetical protein